MDTELALRLLRFIQELALATWLGGLIYICLILPPMPRQDALPPVFVRMMGLMRFRTVNFACLGLLFVTAIIVPLAWPAAGAPATPWLALRALLVAACLVSSLQLNGFLATALAADQARPVPAICDADPSRVDKLLRQIRNVTNALLYCGLGLLAVTALT